MNIIDEAANLLEKGWCKARFMDVDSRGNDKFCAVGAVIAVEKDITREQLDEDTELEESLYQSMNDSPALKVIADTIRKRDPETRRVEEVYGSAGDNVSVVYSFNDGQDDVEPVLEMFRYAAREYDNASN